MIERANLWQPGNEEQIQRYSAQQYHKIKPYAPDGLQACTWQCHGELLAD